MELDQVNTSKAIGMMQSFINTYPNSTRVAEATQIIGKCREKLEEKDYKSAQLYYNIQQYQWRQNILILQTGIPKVNYWQKQKIIKTSVKIILNKYKMSKLRRQQTANTSNVVETKNLVDIKDKTGNLYESIAIIAKRANQISISIKEELHNKLEEFASHTDSLEEIHENKEQIEISKAYERMPNPAILATAEFMEDKIYYRRNEEDNLFD